MPSKTTPLIIFITLVVTCASCRLYEEPKPPTNRLHFPVSVAVHPSGDYIYAVNSNFDTRYDQALGGTVAVINASTGKILPDNSPYIPSFGGIIQLNSTGTKAYIPSRYNDSVTIFNVSPSGDSLYCLDDNQNSTQDPKNCEVTQINTSREVDGVIFGGPKIGKSPYDIAIDTQLQSITISGVSAAQPLSFNTPYLPTQELPNATEINKIKGITAQTVGSNIVLSPTSKFDPPIRVFPKPNQTVTYKANDTAYITSMLTSRISTLFLPDQNLQQLTLYNTDVDADTGAIAKRPHSNDVVAVQRRGSNLTVLQPIYSPTGNDLNAVFKIKDISLSNRASNIYGHGITFNPSGDTAYVISQNPNALYILRIIPTFTYDPSTNQANGTTQNYIIENTVPLKDAPTSITYHPNFNSPQLFIPCTTSKSILVVDANSGAITGDIPLGDTPSHFAINQPKCLNNIQQCVGYVSLFDDTPDGQDSCSTSVAGQCGSIGIIDLNPTSFQYQQLIRKIE